MIHRLTRMHWRLHLFSSGSPTHNSRLGELVWLLTPTLNTLYVINIPITMVVWCFNVCSFHIKPLCPFSDRKYFGTWNQFDVGLFLALNLRSNNKYRFFFSRTKQWLCLCFRAVGAHFWRKQILDKINKWHVL